LHKPYNCLSQFIYNGKRKNSKTLLGDLYDFPQKTMAIGRLDEDSEGLIFLTTDGKLSYYVLSQKVEKEYYVQVDGIITQEAILKLQAGVSIGLHGEKYITKPCKASVLQNVSENPAISYRKIRDDRHGPTSWVSITLTEGKFRQVRKMTAAVGFPTLRLIRVRIGNEKLTLKSSQVREVTHFNLK
jgi:23S rRNA pseudouridine2457 synthase